MPSYVRNKAYTFAGPYGVKRRYSRTGYVWKGAMPYPNQPLTLSDARIDVQESFGSTAFMMRCDRPELSWTPYDGVVNGQYNVHYSTTLAAQPLYARAYRKMVSQLEDRDDMLRSSLGTTLAESGEAAKLMVQRLVSLRKAYQALRRGRFGDFLRALNIRPKSRHRNRWTRPKDASALWLEYWFGWAPLVGDIQATIDVLEQVDAKDRVYRVVGRARSEWTDKLDSIYASTQYHRDYAEFAFESRLRLQVDFTISNPNMYLANRLGLVNPAAVLWEVVPFSFVVDWFVKVGDWLSSFTTWVGLKITESWATYSIRGKILYRGSNYDARTKTQLLGLRVYTGEQYKLRRFKFTPAPPRSLVVDYNSGILTRAITQVALLVSLFTSESPSLNKRWKGK